MKFNANRLALLAGIDSPSSRLLSEGTDVKVSTPDSEEEVKVSEGDDTDEDTDTLDEADDEEGDEDSADPSAVEAALYELGNLRKREEQGDTDENGHQLAENLDEVIEIDEKMLRREIMRMRRQRGQALAEAQIRNVIRSEIGNVLAELDNDDLYSDGSWVYGENKPRRSKKGSVTLGALGLGFE